MSPLLFYIDDLHSVVLETVKVALFGDDVPLISSHHNKLVAEKELQRAITAVAEWSTSKKMVLNADKCEVTFFSTFSHEANWQPTISAYNTRLHHNPLPKFLSHTGQVVNLRPAHPEHIDKGGCQMPIARFPHLEGVGVMKIYKALQLSLLTYVAPAWQPWAAPSRIDQLERCQNKAMRVVTGKLKSTPVERLASTASQLRPSAQRRWSTRRHTGCL